MHTKTKKLLAIAIIGALSSCTTVKHQKMKVDFVGFSDDVSTSYYYTNNCSIKKLRKQSPPFDLINTDGSPNQTGKKQMQKAVFELRQGRQTAAYYALDNALDRVGYVQKKFMEHDPQSKYYVIMLTDGLDTKVENREAYNKRLQQKMSTIMKKYVFFNLFKSQNPNTTNSFQSYILLYQGKDSEISNYTEEELKSMLNPFTGAQNAPVPEPIIGEDLNKMVDILETELVARSFSFRVPTAFVGQRVRMVLNEQKSADPIYFEGLLSNEGGYYSFSNINTSKGLSIKLPAMSYLSGYKTEDGLIHFFAEDIKLNGKPYKINKFIVNQWHEEFGKMRLNSEYSAETSSKRNGYLIVILDASLSFREKYQDAQKAIMRIVDIVSNL
ncbi:MAG: hypothetical protein LBR36_00155 [Bacteroidales bacterium]|jgi:hypothetical protein|nr:hypothetical protein [Bacteroidales bacterium]